MVEMTAPQPPVGFAGARPRLRCAHREVPFVFLRENLAIEPPSGKVTEAAIHKQVRPSGSALARSPPLSGAFQAWEWGINYPDAMKGLMLIVPGARSDRHVHAIFDAVETAIKASLFTASAE